ncbi:hypothetical protein E2C01_054450 [Portunus trituberculatus]|uniref:Uncharacterized protein n=1 Tax=Portunus trituberculatus TaxID=210409 RepID=A0A5B7GS06_PORTR|nr:hypothetical protein [Portunus trituberculatus]
MYGARRAENPILTTNTAEITTTDFQLLKKGQGTRNPDLASTAGVTHKDSHSLCVIRRSTSHPALPYFATTYVG